jgi:hypothetical protein
VIGALVGALDVLPLVEALDAVLLDELVEALLDEVAEPEVAGALEVARASVLDEVADDGAVGELALWPEPPQALHSRIAASRAAPKAAPRFMSGRGGGSCEVDAQMIG